MELREILEHFKKEGKITDQDIEDVLGPSEDLRNFTKTLHTLFCRKNHDTDCTFEQEEVFDEAWKAPAHEEWLEQSRDFLGGFRLTELAGAKCMAAAIHIIKENPKSTLWLIARYINECGDQAF